MGDGDLLREFLARHDAPCPMCGYSLKGLVSTACPECGSAIKLQVRPAEPRMGSWVTGLIGLSAGLGFFLVATGILIWAVIMEGDADDLVEGWPLAIGLLISSIPVVAWLRWSGRIRRIGRATRITLATLTWFYSALITVGLLWVLFEYVIF